MKFDELRNLMDSAYAIRVAPVSELTLNYLMNIAEQAMESRPQAEGMQEITVVITSRDNIYTGTTGDAQWGAELIKQLEAQGDTRVTHLVTWICSTEHRKGLDLPSYQFRKRLMELDEKNAFALLVMQGHECLRASTIGATMP